MSKKNDRYACPSCGCASKWASIILCDSGWTTEGSYVITKIREERYEDCLNLINHEDDTNNYLSIEIFRSNDVLDICLACNTVFS